MMDKRIVSINEFCTMIYQGFQPAVDLTVMLFEVSQVWDDLIDGDTVEHDEINETFLKLLCIIPQNEMFKLMPELSTHLFNIFLRWQDSTTMENNNPSDSDLDKCYMLRAGFYDIIALIAAKLYGHKYAKEIGATVRRFYGEDLNTFKAEFK